MVGKETVLFKSEERHNRDTVAAFLRQLADKLATGQVILRQGDQEVILDIPVNLVLEVKAEVEQKRQDNKRSLEIELEWLEGDDSHAPLTLG